MVSLSSTGYFGCLSFERGSLNGVVLGPAGSGVEFARGARLHDGYVHAYSDVCMEIEVWYWVLLECREKGRGILVEEDIYSHQSLTLKDDIQS